MTKTPKASSPPAHLSREAKALWNEISAEYAIEDAAGRRLLLTACESLDWMRKAEAAVEKDGLTVTDRYGAIRGHPMLATIRDARAAMLAAIKHLGLDLEPLHARPGRPGGSR